MLNNSMYMAKASDVDGKRAGVGRPKLGPTSKMRSMRLTNDEYDFVRWAVKQYRANVASIDVQLFKKNI